MDVSAVSDALPMRWRAAEADENILLAVAGVDLNGVNGTKGVPAACSWTDCFRFDESADEKESNPDGSGVVAAVPTAAPVFLRLLSSLDQPASRTEYDILRAAGTCLLCPALSCTVAFSYFPSFLFCVERSSGLRGKKEAGGI